MKNKYRTDFLLNDNNFIIGMATTFNFWGNFFIYNESEDDYADINALTNDWGVIAQDLKEVMTYDRFNK